jgi:hypothetical protein
MTLRLETLGACLTPGNLIDVPEAVLTAEAYGPNKSHIAAPQRLSRLLMAACLASIWIVYPGALCLEDGWRGMGLYALKVS